MRLRAGTSQPASERVLYRQEYGWGDRHILGALGLRRPIAQHTPAEGRLLQRYCRDARCAVEIGVAEGGSAWELRRVIDPRGTLYLIDPYPPGQLFGIRMARIVAHRLVDSVPRGRVVWIEKPSHEAAADWDGSPIDFLFIDGDHSFEAVSKDWDDWSRQIRPGGIVVLHDARLHEPEESDSSAAPEEGPARLARLISANHSTEWSLVDGVDSSVVFERASSPGRDH